MQLGEAFIQLSVQLAPSAAKDIEGDGRKAGENAGTAMGKAIESSVAKMTLKSPDATKAYAKAGEDAGAAMVKAVQSNVDKVRLNAPDAKAAYTKAGAEAGGALSKSVNDAANKITLKSPDIKAEYSRAGQDAGKALSTSVNSSIKVEKIQAPDAKAAFAAEGDKAGKSFAEKVKSGSSGLGNIGQALGVQLIGAFNSEVDFSKTARNFQQSLGASKTEAKALGLAAGSLFANGLADGMDDAEQAISATINSISGIRDQGAPAIAELASAALGVSKAFGQDLDATLRATGQLMRTGLAKDGKEALDIIAGGLQKIPGAAEDLLDTFVEYSGQFKKIGLDGKDALGIISQLMEGGARNTDLAADALKEFSIRAIDGSKNVEEAFTEIGLDAAKMSRTFAEGGPKARQAFGEVVDALNKMEDPLKRNQAGVELFGTQWEDLGDAFRKADLKTAGKELGDLNGIADQVGGNSFGEKFKSNLSKLSGVATGIAGVLGLSFATSFDDAMDFKQTNDKVARDLGLTGPSAKQIGAEAGKLYSSGLGDGLSDVSEAIDVVGKSMPSIAKQGVPALAAVTKSALTLKKNFDIDVGESANSVGKLIKTGLVKDATEGFDLIATGMTKIPRAGEDLIDTVNEYSVQFQKLGLTGQDTFGLIKQLMEGGARDTDLAADAIKEFSIRAVDGSTTSATAFKALGLDAKALTATFAKGGPEARAAFGTVTDALNKMEDPVKRNAAGVALFGTQWEDLGGAFKSVDLKTAATGLGNIAGANSQVIKTSPTQVVENFKRAIEATFITVLADKVIPAFAKFITFIKDNGDLLKTLAVSVGVLGAAYVVLNTAMAVSAGGGLLTFIKTAVTSTKAWTVAQFALNAVMNANPIGIVVTAVTALIAVIVLLYKNNETVRKVIDAAWAGIKTAMSAVADWFTKTAWPAMKAAFDALGKAAEWLWKNALKPAWDGIKVVIDVVWAALKIVFAAWKTEYTALGTAATWLWKNVLSPAWDGIKTVITVAWTAIKVIFAIIVTTMTLVGKGAQALWDLMKLVWGGIKTAISTAWNFIKTSVLDVWQSYIKGPFTAMWNAFKAFFETLWTGLKTFLTTTWNAIRTGVFIVWETYIKGPFTTMWNAFKTFFTTLWNGLKTFLMATWTAIKTTVLDVWAAYIKGPFTAMWNAFKTFFTTLWNAIKAMLLAAWTYIKTTVLDVWAAYIKGPFTAMWNAFKGFITALWDAIKSMMQAAWNWIKNNVFSPIKSGLDDLKAKWQLWKTAIGIVWDQWKDKIGSVWTSVKSAVFTPMVTFVTKTIPDAFTKCVSAVKTAWDKISDIMKTPVRFVANTVLRDGLFKAYNAIASKVNAPTVDWGGVSFATGGVLPGYTPGRDVHQFVSPTGGRLNLSGGEAIMRPEFTRAVGTGAINALNGAARSGGVNGVKSALGMARGGVVGFAEGGVVENTKDAIKKGVSAGFNGMKSIAAGIISPLSGMVNGLVNSIPGAGPFISLLKTAVKSILGQAGKFVTGFGGGGRGGGGVLGVGGSNGAPIAAGYQAQIANLAHAGFDLRFANSQLTGGGHSRTSNHYRGRAIDIGVGTNGQGQVERVWDYLVKNYAKSSLELYWAQKAVNYRHGQEIGPTDKTNHIHWAMKNGGVFKYDSGGWLEPGMTGVNRGGKPEAVLTPAESQGLKNMGVGELADLLRELIEAVERIAPGVTAGIRGTGANLRTAGRSV